MIEHVILAILAAALIVVVLLWGVISARQRQVGVGAPPESGRPLTSIEDGRAIVTLDLGAVDPESGAAQRLADDTVSRVFATAPDAEVVEVRTRDGIVLAVRRRETPLEIDIPETLYEPHAMPHRGPDLSDDVSERARQGAGGTSPGIDREGGPVTVAPRTLAERFELPRSVQERLGDPDDAIGLVRAILESAGLQVDARGDVIRVGDEVVVVIAAPIGEPVPNELMSHAYREFRESGARRGVVVSPGYLDPGDVRRREAFDASLRHVGPEGIQRMADAVEVGGDPIRFAAGPAFHG